MPASALLTRLRARRRLLLALGAFLLVAVIVTAAVVLRPDAEPVTAGATGPASPTADAGGESTTADGGKDQDDSGAAGADPAGTETDAETDAGPAGTDTGTDTASEPRETLDPEPFGAEVTPEPGVAVTVTSVEKVTGEASVPGEVGGPALRFAVEVRNGTDTVLDLRTVVVNAYYGPDRAPTTPLLKPGARAFEPELEAGGSADAAFVFSVPSEFQDRVELEIDPGVGSPIVIFTGA